MDDVTWFVAQVEEKDAQWKVHLGNGLISHRAEFCIIKGEIMLLEEDTWYLRPYDGFSDEKRREALMLGRLKRIQKQKSERKKRLVYRQKENKEKGNKPLFDIGA